MSNVPPIRVLIAEANRSMRDSIAVFLERAPDIQVIGVARNGREAIQRTRRLAPDVLVTEIALLYLDGIEVTGWVYAHHPQTQVVIFTASNSRISIQRALQRGAKAYVWNRFDFDELIPAIRAAHEGELYLSATLSGGS